MFKCTTRCSYFRGTTTVLQQEGLNSFGTQIQTYFTKLNNPQQVKQNN